MSTKIKPIECPVIVANIASVKEVARSVGAVYSDGVWWKMLRKGFWWPLDFTTPVDIGRKPPKTRMWGYQHINYSDKSNSNFRNMFIDDLENYNSENLKKNFRRMIRKSLSALEFKKIQRYGEKEVQNAADCWNALVERTKWKKRKKMSNKVFSRYWNNLLTLPGHTVIGAYHGGQLVGWIVGMVFDNGNCYTTRIASLKQYFIFGVNDGLRYMFLVSAKNSGAKNSNDGLFIPNRIDLDKFKEHIGFKLTSFPAYVYINPIIKPFVTRFSRNAFDRLTGWYSESKE